jgi:endonuclease/exonuclease/phosphatase family metal-dependent hydrolase
VLLANWNIFIYNKRFHRGLEFLLSKNPDIITLQEARKETIDYIKSKGYDAHFVNDTVKIRRKGLEQYIATFTRHPITQKSIFEYADKPIKSLLSVGYKILGNTEKHAALVTKIEVKNQTFNVLNMRLSAASGPTFRLDSFRKVSDYALGLENPIICGDLNTIQWDLVKAMTGWARGFKLKEYKIKEGPTLERMIKERQLRNHFSGQDTTVYGANIVKLPLQLDYIITNSQLLLENIEISRRSFGSDHKILFARTD